MARLLCRRQEITDARKSSNILRRTGLSCFNISLINNKRKKMSGKHQHQIKPKDCSVRSSLSLNCRFRRSHTNIIGDATGAGVPLGKYVACYYVMRSWCCLLFWYSGSEEGIRLLPQRKFKQNEVADFQSSGWALILTVVVVLLYLASGSALFHYIEDWPLSDSLYALL